MSIVLPDDPRSTLYELIARTYESTKTELSLGKTPDQRGIEKIYALMREIYESSQKQTEPFESEEKRLKGLLHWVGNLNSEALRQECAVRDHLCREPESPQLQLDLSKWMKISRVIDEVKLKIYRQLDPLQKINS